MNGFPESVRMYRKAIFDSLLQSIFFIGEYPKVLYSVHQIKSTEIAEVDERLEANRFYHTMNNVLNHRSNPLCNDKCVLIRFAGK